MGPLTALLIRATEPPPVVPDADTGRRLLEQELAKPEYHGGPSLLEQLLNWLNKLFEGAPNLGFAPLVSALAIVSVVAIIAVITFVIAGPIRRRARGTTGAAVDADDDRTAAEFRRAADAAAASGDWSLAIIERFRALARSLEERAVLDERSGRTAHEFAVEAAPRFEELAHDLARGAELFDGVCYGERPAHGPDDAFLRALDDQLAQARPRPSSTLTNHLAVPV